MSIKYNHKSSMSPKLSKYKEALLDMNKRVVVSLGLPLTGKTAMAIECAMRDLEKGFYDKLILVREPLQSKCGYLKGDHLTKMAPYIKQADTYIQLNSQDTLMTLIDRGRAEVVEPIFLQGNRYERCIVVIDEAQNIHRDVTFKVLTRIAAGCKFVICGDISSGQKNEKIKIEDSMPYYLFDKFANDRDLRENMSFHTFYDKDNDILGDDFCKLLINKLYDDFVNVDQKVIDFNKLIAV